MSRITESIEVNCPVTTVYNQWTQFEEFPEFMDGVQQVQQMDDTTLHWTATIAGNTKEWKAKIIEQTPDRRVAWESIDGARNDGAVWFESLGGDRTRVNLELDVEPEGMLESAGDALGFVQRRAKGDLERFREFIESRGAETGAWRGEVHGGQATGTSSGAMGTGTGTVGSGVGAGSSMGSTGMGSDLGSSGMGSTGMGSAGMGSTGMGSTGMGSTGDDWTRTGTGTGTGSWEEPTSSDLTGEDPTTRSR